MRFPLKKLLGTVAVICIIGFLSISGILRPLNKQETENSDPEDMQLQSRRMPLVMTGNGPGSPEVEKNASESESTSNFTRAHGKCLFRFSRFHILLSFNYNLKIQPKIFDKIVALN